MQRPRHACLALIIFVLASCAPSYRWTPHKLEFAQPGRELVVGAVLVYAGDLDALIAADAELLGSIRAGGPEVAASYAARYGGTHVVLIVDASYDQKLWTSCSVNANTVWCSDRTRHVPVKHYAVVRVPRERWDSLPELLHPGRGVSKGLACRVLPAREGCRYSHDDGWGHTRWERVFLHCGEDDEAVEVTDAVGPNTCPFDKGA